MFSGTPVLALTGTADGNTLKTIISKLILKDPVQIVISPNRKNLRFTVKKTKKESMFGNLDWLVMSLQENGVNAEKTIIFCNMMSDIAHVVNYLMLKLGRSAFSPQESNAQKDCLIGIYHSSSWQRSKDRVLKSFKAQGKMRVVVASTALSMGVNFPDVRYILNWGPPRNLLDFHQEAGRAGRDNLQSEVIIVYHGHQLSHCEEAVKLFVRAENESCLRVAAYLSLDKRISSLEPGHQCCAYCSGFCQCQGSSCNASKSLFEIFHANQVDTERNHLLTRPVTESDKDDLSQALIEFQSTLETSNVLGDVSTHGFSSELVEDVINNICTLFTIKDVMDTCPVFSLSHAMKILEIIQETFLDIPNFDESMNMLQDDSTGITQSNCLREVLDRILLDEDFTEEEVPEFEIFSWPAYYA